MLASSTPLLAAPPPAFTANIVNGATTISVDFVYHPIRGANFQVLMQDAAGALNPVTAPEARTYIGTVTGYPGATACALLQPDGTLWEYVIFEAGDQWWADNGTVTWTYGSPAFTPTWPTAAVVTPTQAATVTTVVAGDIIADIPYNNFASTHGSSVNHAVYVTEFCLMETNLIYMRDIGFLHRIGRVVIRGTQAKDPYQTGDGLQTLRGQFIPFTGHECLKFVTVPGYGGGAALLGTVGDSYSGASINDSDGRGDAFIYWRHEVGHNHGAGDQIGWYCENYTLLNANQVGRMSGPEEAAMIASRHGGPSYGGDVMENLGTYAAFNLPPRASLDLASAEPGVSVIIDVMANDHDSNGDTFSLLSVDALSAHGATLTRSVGTGPGGRDQISYTGSNTFTAGLDHFQYRIQDAHGSQALGNVYVKVAITNPELCAYWALDESTGTSAVNDAGTANATVYNGASWVTGTVNGGLSFNGVNQYAKAYVDVPETETAVSLWFRTSQASGGLYSVTEDSGGHDRHLYLTGGNIRARIYSEETIASSGKNYGDGQWHQLVHTFGSTVGGQKLYVDGVLVASGTKSQSDFTWQKAIQLGYSASSPTPYFTGQIDDVRIWKRTLSAADALALAQRSGTANKPVPPTATIFGGQNLTLDWLAPTGATSHDIYLGSYAGVRSATTASPEFQGDIATKPFVSTTTPAGFYYWRADERRATSVFKGPIWYFQYLGATGANPVILTQSTTWWVNANDTFTQSGVISGTGPLFKDGGGTLFLTGDNTFTAGLTLSNGILQVGSGGTTGTLGTGTVTNNSTLVFNRSDAFTFSGTLTGTGSVIQTGPGTLTLSGGAISHSGTTTLNGGNLTLTATTGFNSAIQITSGQLTCNSTGNYVLLSKPVSGTGPVQVNGGGSAWTYMAGDNSYTGGTVINSGGMLLLGNNTTTGSVLGMITDNGNLGIYHSDAWTFTNNVTGTGTFSLYSPGGNSCTVSGGNTIAVATLSANQNPGGILSNTTVNLTGALNLASNSTLTVAAGANVTAAGGMTQGGNAYNGTKSYLRVTGGTLTFGNYINDGWDGAYTIIQTGGMVSAPGITGGNGGGTWPTDTYTLEGGTLTLGANGIWGPYYKWPWGSGVTMVLNLSGGTLAASANWSTSYAANLTNTTGNVTVNPAGFTIGMNGVLSGAGGLNLAGAGTLTLAGANTYTGTTTIANGTLSLTGSLANTATTIATTIAATGTLAGTGTITGTVSNNGTISPGTTGAGNLTINNVLTLAPGAAVAWQISDWTGAAGSGYDKITAGSLDITATAANPVTITVSQQALTHFSSANKNFVLVQTTSGITGFDSSKFVVNKTGFTSGSGSWLVLQSGTNLVLRYVATNNAPTFTANPITRTGAAQGSVYSGTLAGTATDSNTASGDILAFSKTSGPAWLTVAADGTLSGTPANGDVGTNIFNVRVTDAMGLYASAALNLTVTNVNDAPAFVTSPITGTTGAQYTAYTGTLAGTAGDPDLGYSDTITYAKVSGPAWLTIAVNGMLGGTPLSASAGLNTFVVRVTDSFGLSADATLQIQVTPGNPDINGNGILDSWEITHFGNANPGDNAASDDADGDGLSNLLEYAVGSNPLVSNANPLSSGLEPIDGNLYLRLTVPKNPEATNLTYTVEVCGELFPESWTAADTQIESDTTTELRVRDTVATDAAQHRFIRLKLTANP